MTPVVRACLAMSPVPFVAAVGLTAAHTPGYSHGDFVSELGQSGAPHAGWFGAGLLGSALLVGAAAVLGRRTLPGGGPTAFALGIVALALSTAKAAPCSPRCPLVGVDPGAGLSDLIHFAASSSALGASAGMMAWVALTGTAGGWRWRWASLASSAAVMALSAVFLVVVVAHLRPALGVTERLLFAVIGAWTAALAAYPSSSGVRTGTNATSAATTAGSSTSPADPNPNHRQVRASE